MENETLYAIALSIISSPSSFGLWNRIRNKSAEQVYKESASEKKIQTADFINRVYHGDPMQCAEKIAEKCIKEKVGIINFRDSGYPPLLREISSPPPVLYTRGTHEFGQSIAVVGTRVSDSRSESVASRLSSELGAKGLSIASGIAIGIDRAAHAGALERGYPTIAVMANGIDIVYPKANMDIYNKITASGNSIILSEYPPGIIAGKWTFVRRNRIISGISLGTVVVKAGIKSGSLITARYALEQNRLVFACGGLSYDDGYEGCYRLIREGAVPVFKSGDIFNELGIKNSDDDKTSDKKAVKSSEVDVFMEETCVFDKNSLEKKIMSYLISGSLDFDEIIRISGAGAPEAAEALMNLELNGLISRKGNMISPSG